MLGAGKSFTLSRPGTGSEEILLVSSAEAHGQCRDGSYEEVDAALALQLIERVERLDKRRLAQLRYFVSRIRLTRQSLSHMDDRKVLELVRQAIRKSDLVAVRKAATAGGKATDATVEQRKLVREIEDKGKGRLDFGGRRYKLVADADLNWTPDRDSFQVVARTEAQRVLGGIAKASGAAADLAALLAKASAKLSADWSPPLSADGLILLRKIVAAAAPAKADTGPAITPSEMKAMVESTEEPTIRLVSVEALTFVPGQEKDAISYAIDGPVAKASSVVMIVNSVPAKGTPKEVGKVAIPGPYAASGKVDWDGKLSGSGALITLKGSPYEVTFELTSTSGKVSTSGPGKIQLEVKEIKIVVDDTVPAPADQSPQAVAFRDFIAELKKSGMPADCEGRLLIHSPIFKVASSEMDDDTSYKEYQKPGKTVPAVPLRALVKLKSKSGDGKRSPLALVDTRILWDVKLPAAADLDADLDARGVETKEKAFIKKVDGYEEALTRPKGVSAHFKVGGFRAKLGDRATAGLQWLQDGFWGLTAGTAKRNWATYSICVGDDTSTADSAVSFCPGRVAGDVHKVRAMVDIDETALDVEDEAMPDSVPATRRSNTIKITVWRSVPLVANWIVGASTKPVDVPSLSKEYKKAAMRIEPAKGVAPKDVDADWQKAYETVVDGHVKSGKEFLKDALERTHEGYPVRYRSFMDYWERMNPSVGFFGRLWQRFISFFGAGDKPKYQKKREAYALTIVQETAVKLKIPEEGITALKFDEDGPHNQIPTSSFTAGWAPSIPTLTDRNKAIFFQFTSGKDTLTFIHEVGHTLFLAHAPGHFDKGKQPDGYQPDAHDKDEICIMSYHPDQKYLCGLCLLKLGGVNYTKIKNDGTLI